MANKPYRFIEDPAHGWLEVLYAELVSLGLNDEPGQISKYSYMSPCMRYVYLEEDCDMTKFLIAKGLKDREAANAWMAANVERKFQNCSSMVRNYKRFGV